MNLTTSGVMYCITHEEEVDVITGWHFISHYSETNLVCNFDWCAGPFTTCPPPAVPNDWDLLVTPPDDEFMAQSDACAEELMQEILNG